MKCSYVVYKYTKHENVNCHCKLGHIELLECLHYSKYHIWDIFLFSHLCFFIFIKYFESYEYDLSIYHELLINL